MNLTQYIIQLTQLPGDTLFGKNGNGSSAMVRLAADASGKPSISYWNVPNVTEPTVDDLVAALAAPAPGPTPAALTAYATQAWTALLAKGQTFNVAASGETAIDVLSDGTNDTRADLALLALYGQQNPTGSKSWLDNNGVVTVLTGTELVTLASLVGNWISDTYPALQGLLASINATSPTVTTTAEIDAFTWPTA